MSNHSAAPHTTKRTLLQVMAAVRIKNQWQNCEQCKLTALQVKPCKSKDLPQLHDNMARRERQRQHVSMGKLSRECTCTHTLTPFNFLSFSNPRSGGPTRANAATPEQRPATRTHIAPTP